MKKKFTILIAAAVMLLTMMATTGTLWGQTRDEVTTTYIFNSKSWGAQIGTTNANWTSKKDGNQLTTGQGIQVTTGASGACGNSDVSYSNVSKITVTYCTNASKGAGSISWYNVSSTTANAQSGTLVGTQNISAPSSNGTQLRTFDIEPNSSQTGFIQLYVTCTTNSIYVYSVKITYTTGGSGPTTYTVTYDANGGTGTMTDENSPYEEGDEVTLLENTFTAPTGYAFNSWAVTDGSSNPVTVTNNTFTMPASNVTVTAQWASAGGDYITVTPTTANVACAGDDVEFTVVTDQTLDDDPTQFYTTSTGDVTTTKPAWIGDILYDEGEMVVEVSANTGAARTAYFKVEKGSVKSDVVTINQAAYAPAAPTLPAAGDFDYTKEIEIAVPDGTTVYYTLDGSNPSNESTAYSGTFTINATKTVKAVAYEGDYPSAVVSATYTRTYDYISSIDNTSTTYTVKGTVVAVNGTTGFVLGDGTGYVYNYKSHSLSVGDKVAVNGKVSNYNYGYQFKADGTDVETSNYTTGTPAITTLTGDIYDSYHSTGAVNLSTYFEVIGTYSNTNKDITLAGTTKHVRLLTSTDFSSLDGKAVKAKGYFIYYNSYFFICPENVEAVPVVTASVTSISDFTYNVGGGPDVKSFTVSGANLTDDLTVTASTNYKVCKTSDGEYTTSVSYEPSTGTVASTTVYVRLEAGLSSNTYEGTVTVASTGADDKVVALTGTVKHTITIDPSIENGAVNSDPSEAALAGATVTLTAEPAANYKLGYFTVTKAGSGTVDVTPTGANTGTFTMPADNVTVSATFTQAYAVTYAANGGSGTMTDPNSPYVAGTQVTLLANTFTYTGHTWSSWLVKNVSTDETITPDGEGKFEMPASAVTVTAQWTTNTHNITMPDADAYGEYTTASTTDVEFGTEVTLTYTPASGYEHYVAVWSVNGTPIDGNTFNMPDEDVTVTVATHATWTVTYNANGGTGSMSDPNSPYDHGANVSVLANGFTYINHTFVKWNTQADGEGTDYLPGATISSISANVTLYAQWESGSHVTYTVASTSSVSTSGSAPLGSTATFTQTYGTACQMTKDNSMTLTLKGYQAQTIKSIVLSMKSNNSGGAGNMTAKAGETTLTSIETAAFNTSSWHGSWSTSYVNITPTMSTTSYEIQSGEDIVITINATTSSLYCRSFTINYETSDSPTVITSATEQTVTHASQSITTGDKVFELYSLNIATPTFALAYCDEDGNVLDSNPYLSWFTPEVTDNEKVTYSVTANSGKDRTAYFKVYATVAGDPVYSSLCSVTQKHQPYTYTLVDGSTVTLEAGKHYIITSGTSGTVYAMGYQKSSNRDAVSVSFTGEKINETEDVYEFVISGDNTNNWTIYDIANSKYLYASSSSSNNLNIQETNDANGQWAISISEGVASIVAQGTNSRKVMQFNSTLFSCYASASQSSVYLYKRDGDTDLEFHSPTTLTSATIAATETYTIESGQVLEVTGDLTNNGNASNLIIEDGGQLISNNPVQATIKKSITGYDNGGKGDNDGWYFITTPVAAGTTPTVANGVLDGTYDLYYYNEPTHYWFNYKSHDGNEDSGFASDGGKLLNGKGYLYANTANADLSFEGATVAANAEVTIPLSYTTSLTPEGLRGFNLVGNPFTYNLTSTSSITLGGADFATYYRIEEGVGITATNITDIEIQPGVGFMVQAEEENQNLVFNPSAKGDRAAAKLSYIRIMAGNDSFMDHAYIQFGNFNTLRKYVLNDETPQVYVINDGLDWAATILDKPVGEMPVNFKATENGTYTISVNAENLDMGYLHLIDNKTGMDVDLLQTPSYTFEASKIDYASRFRLVFSAINNQNDNDNENNDFGFFDASGNLMILGIDGTATLQVIDITGRAISNETFNGNYSKAINAKAGVYMLRLIQGDAVRTQKIVVK